MPNSLIVLLAFLGTGFLNFLWTQEYKIDSLIEQLEKVTENDKAKIYNDLSLIYKNNDEYQKCIDNGMEALRIAEKYDDSYQKYLSFLNIASANSKIGNTEQAISYNLQALEIALELDNINYKARVYNQLGIDYMKLGDFEKSVKYYFLSLSIIEDTLPGETFEKNQKYKALVLNNIGTVYSKMENSTKALGYYEKALQIRKLQNDTDGIASCLQNIGVVYSNTGKPEKALELYNEALNILRPENNKRSNAQLILNIGIIYNDLKKQDKALKMIFEAVNKFEEIGDMTSLAVALTNLANIYLEMDKPNIALPFINKSLKISKDIKLKNSEIESYKLLSKFYVSIGDYKNGWINQSKYIELKDSINITDINKKIADTESIREIEKKEQEIEIQKIELQRKDAVLKQKTYQRNAVVTGFIMAVILIIFIFLAYRQKIISNIKLRKQQKEIEDQNTKLTELDATKNKFFSIIAHDIKSPFNSILGFSNLLFDDFDNYSEEEKKGFVKNIRNSSEETFKLLENLLDWSRSQSKSIEFKPEKLFLQKIINETIHLLQGQLENKKINFRSEISETLEVFADKNMLKTILRNLLSNAIKYSFSEGEVSLHAIIKDDFVEIKILDTGVGLRKVDINKLFRIDEKIKTKGTANETGTGLGLILCKEFVEKNNGTIWVKSPDDGNEKGSSFYFTMPVIR
ncbi:MAG: hypothetical protein B6D61_02960 [Bacteroidetes bacterium 4484_249]|nr:MAG: hypothetical protein B6D61_02960 [Bacteroidetes bacterium 4484_249]